MSTKTIKETETKWLYFLKENDNHFLDIELEQEIVSSIKSDPNYILDNASMNNLCSLFSIITIHSFFEIAKTFKEHKVDSIFPHLLGFARGAQYYNILINRLNLFHEHNMLKHILSNKEATFVQELIVKLPSNKPTLHCNQENGNQDRVLEFFMMNNLFTELITSYFEKKQLEKIITPVLLHANKNKI